MASLPASVQYALSSGSTNKDNKEIVFVKLTDSALNAIEDFLRSKGNGLAKPKIQFLTGNDGKISIPSLASGEATFNFSINSNAVMEDAQGSFECVTSGGSRQLETYGPLPRRMRVHANDDSYSAAWNRMASAVAAEQSKCTRVMKPKQTDSRNRIKVRTAHASSFARATQLAERTERAQRPERPERQERPKRVKKPERAQRPLPSASRLQHPPASLPQNPTASKPLHPPASCPKLPPAAPSHQLERVERSDRAQRPVSSESRNSHQRPASKIELTKRSIKERLIQLLALKAYKKPEIQTRLSNEGIKDIERSLLTNILMQISTPKDNCYYLKRYIWNSVNEDWPFYTEEEKSVVQIRKPLNLSPPLSGGSANSLSPRASCSAGKRPSSAVGLDGLPAGPSSRARGTAVPACTSLLPDEPPHKKRRTSRDRRTSSPSSGYATNSSGERQTEVNDDERTNLTNNSGYTLNTNKDLSSSPVEQFETTTAELPLVRDEDLDYLKSIERSSWIRMEYPPITKDAMRQEYMNDYADLYPKYTSLYSRLAQVAALFNRLEVELQSADPLSIEHKQNKQRIRDERRRVENDPGYKDDTKNFHYLHAKLAQLKLMVYLYDISSGKVH